MSCNDDNPELGFGSESKCNLDPDNNVWVEGRDVENNVRGVCILDTASEEQVIYILQRDEKARKDLCRVTSDDRLLELAATVPRLAVVENDDRQQSQINRQADSIPFYSIFRGQPPFAQ